MQLEVDEINVPNTMDLVCKIKKKCGDRKKEQQQQQKKKKPAGHLHALVFQKYVCKSFFLSLFLSHAS